MAKKLKHYICGECGARGFKQSICPQCEEDMLSAVYEDTETGEEVKESYLNKLFGYGIY